MAMESKAPLPEHAKAQALVVVNNTFAIAECIKALKQVPSGHLYAQVMHKMDLPQFQSIIDLLIEAGVVRQQPCHLLEWIGPVPTSE